MDYSNLFVCLMGIGTVFIGLICIILLVSLMSAVCRKLEKKTPSDSFVEEILGKANEKGIIVVVAA